MLVAHKIYSLEIISGIHYLLDMWFVFLHSLELKMKVLSDCKIEDLYCTLYEMDLFEPDYGYAIQCLLQIEFIEKELKGFEVKDPVAQFRLDNLQAAMKIRKDFFKLRLTQRRQELDLWFTFVIAFVFMQFGFYKFSGLFS